MQYLFKSFASLLPLTLMVLGLSACSSDSGDTSSGAGQSNLNVYLTDAPTDEVSSVVVAITGLTIKPSSSSVEREIFNQTRQVDLLALQNSRILLTSVSVPAGSYQFIRVDLNESQSHVIANGEKKPVKISSEEIKVLGGFEVPVQGQVDILLDFDAKASLVKLGDNNWLLKPVIIKK